MIGWEAGGGLGLFKGKPRRFISEGSVWWGLPRAGLGDHVVSVTIRSEPVPFRGTQPSEDVTGATDSPSQTKQDRNKGLLLGVEQGKIRCV